MLSPLRVWFQMCSLPFSDWKVTLKWMHRIDQTGMCSHCKVTPRSDLNSNFFSTGLWGTQITFIPRQAAGVGRRGTYFHSHQEQFVKWVEAAPEAMELHSFSMEPDRHDPRFHITSLHSFQQAQKAKYLKRYCSYYVHSFRKIQVTGPHFHIHNHMETTD